MIQLTLDFKSKLATLFIPGGNVLWVKTFEKTTDCGDVIIVTFSKTHDMSFPYNHMIIESIR